MKIRQLKEILDTKCDLNEKYLDHNIVISAKGFGSVGGTSATEVKGVVSGIDWDHGRLLIIPANPLKLDVPSDPTEDLKISEHKAKTIANALRLTANIYNCRNKKGKRVSDGNGGYVGAETAWDRAVILAEKYIKEILEPLI